MEKPLNSKDLQQDSFRTAVDPFLPLPFLFPFYVIFIIYFDSQTFFRCISSVENILEHAQEPMESQNNANVNNKHEFWAKQDQYEQSQNQQVHFHIYKGLLSIYQEYVLYIQVLAQSREIKESQSNSKRGSPTTHLKGVGRTKQIPQGGRTALVSAVPRTNKLKVSGGTQTATTDFQQSKYMMKFKNLCAITTSPYSCQKLFIIHNIEVFH